MYQTKIDAVDGIIILPITSEYVAVISALLKKSMLTEEYGCKAVNDKDSFCFKWQLFTSHPDQLVKYRQISGVIIENLPKPNGNGGIASSDNSSLPIPPINTHGRSFPIIAEMPVVTPRGGSRSTVNQPILV